MALIDRQRQFGSLILPQPITLDYGSVPRGSGMTSDERLSRSGFGLDQQLNQIYGTVPQQTKLENQRIDLQNEARDALSRYGRMSYFLGSDEGKEWQERYKKYRVNQLWAQNTTKELARGRSFAEANNALDDFWIDPITRRAVTDEDGSPRKISNVFRQLNAEAGIDEDGNVFVPEVPDIINRAKADAEWDHILTMPKDVVTKSERYYIGGKELDPLNMDTNIAGWLTQKAASVTSNKKQIQSVLAMLLDKDVSEIKMGKDSVSVLGDVDLSNLQMGDDLVRSLVNDFYKHRERMGKKNGEYKVGESNTEIGNYIADRLSKRLGSIVKEGYQEAYSTKAIAPPTGDGGDQEGGYDYANFGQFIQEENLYKLGSLGKAQDTFLYMPYRQGDQTIYERSGIPNYFFEYPSYALPKELKDKTFINAQTAAGNINIDKTRINTFGSKYAYMIENGNVVDISSSNAVVYDVVGVMLGDAMQRDGASGTSPVRTDGGTKKIPYIVVEVYDNKKNSTILNDPDNYFVEAEQKTIMDKTKQQANISFQNILTTLDGHYKKNELGQEVLDVDAATEELRERMKESPVFKRYVSTLQKEFAEISKQDEDLYQGPGLLDFVWNVEIWNNKHKERAGLTGDLKEGQTVIGPDDYFGVGKYTDQFDQVYKRGRRFTKGDGEFSGQGFHDAVNVPRSIELALGVDKTRRMDGTNREARNLMKYRLAIPVNELTIPFLGDQTKATGSLINSMNRAVDEQTQAAISGVIEQEPEQYIK